MIGVAFVHTGVPNWPVTIVLAAVTAIAERLAPRVSATVEMSVSFLPIALAAVLFGPAVAGIVAGCSMLGYVREWPVDKFSVFTSARALGGAAAGWGAQMVIPAGSTTVSLPRLLVAAAAASLAWTVVDFVTNSAVGWLRGVIGPRALWRNMRGTVMVAVALYIPVTALFAYAYLGAGEWVLAFFAIPTAAAHLTLRALANLTSSRDALAEANLKLEQSNMQLRRVNLSFTRAMVRALDARDNWTAEPFDRRGGVLADICGELQWDVEICERIHLVGMVHDVGKIAVPSEILQKTSALTDDEWALMREHSAEGEKILREVEGYDDIATVVRSHHERWDGAGLPGPDRRRRLPGARARDRGCRLLQRHDHRPPVPRSDDSGRGDRTARAGQGHLLRVAGRRLHRRSRPIRPRIPPGHGVQGLRDGRARAHRIGPGRGRIRPARHR